MTAGTHSGESTSATIEAAPIARPGRLVLARHGQTSLNADGRLRGHLDPPLDATGLREVAALAASLSAAPVRRVVTSPLRRAVQTGQAIARASGVEVVVDPGLIDRDYGRWAGDRTASVVGRWGSLDAAPGVEPVDGVLARSRAALDRQVPYLGQGQVVVVAHDMVNRLLLHDLDAGLGPADTISQGTACWNLLRWESTGWRVERVDERAS